jgi:short-subunit dehydrogenase
MAVYYASKAYVLSFSEALRCSQPHGVRVTGYVRTVPSNLGTGGFMPGFDSAILNVSPSDVAGGYRGLMADKRAVLSASA